MKKTLNEEISQIKNMMGKIMNENFDDESLAPHGGGFTQDGNPMGFDDFDTQIHPEEMGDDSTDLFADDSDELSIGGDAELSPDGTELSADGGDKPMDEEFSFDFN